MTAQSSTLENSIPESSTREDSSSEIEELEIPIEIDANVEERHDHDPLSLKTEAVNNHVVNNEVDNNEVDDLANVRFEKIDDDLTMIIEGDYVNAFIPIQSQFGVKRNDEFSGTLPYEEDVSKY